MEINKLARLVSRSSVQKSIPIMFYIITDGEHCEHLFHCPVIELLYKEISVNKVSVIMEQDDLSIYTIVNYVIMEFKISTLRLSSFFKKTLFPFILYLVP